MLAEFADRLVVATTSEGKLREIRDALRPAALRVTSLSDLGWRRDIPETGSTFAENAIIKAQTVCDESGLPALADDSGLEVDDLEGRPGVHSSRFAGPDADDDDRNRELVRLLGEAGGEPPWPAQYRCVLAYAQPGAEPVTFEGVCRGAIVPHARGSGGFGYDPHFLLPDRDVTVGEISLAEKQAISHRGEALRRFVRWIQDRQGARS